MDYKKRFIEPKISELFEIFPIVSITGPRQSGKSTLIKHYTNQEKEKWDYISLDNRETLLYIKEDPSLFVRSIKSNIAIDEAQKAPELFHALKELVDEKHPYKIILSGSANFLLLKSISESLAGRVGLLELEPFSLAEAHGLKTNSLVSKIISSNSIDELYKQLVKLESKQFSCCLIIRLLCQYLNNVDHRKIPSPFFSSYTLLISCSSKITRSFCICSPKYPN
jgi:predicted AAA+ superfamily ATPase